MTLDQLRYFLETARTEHVGRAARACAISPSAVSHAVAQLERELGCLLFERRGKTLALTSRGRELERKAGRILGELASLPASLSQDAPVLRGHFRIGASHWLAPRLLATAWAKLTRKHPDFSAELSSLRTSQALSQTLAGELRAALCFSPLPHSELQAAPLAAGRLLLTVRRGHPAARRGWKALQEYPSAFYNSAAGVEICETHPALLKAGLRSPVRLYFDDDELGVEALIRSDLWSLLPEPVVRSRRKELAVVAPPSGFSARFEIALVSRLSRRADPETELLLQELREILPPLIAPALGYRGRAL